MLQHLLPVPVPLPLLQPLAQLTNGGTLAQQLAVAVFFKTLVETISTGRSKTLGVPAGVIKALS